MTSVELVRIRTTDRWRGELISVAGRTPDGRLDLTYQEQVSTAVPSGPPES